MGFACRCRGLAPPAVHSRHRLRGSKINIASLPWVPLAASAFALRATAGQARLRFTHGFYEDCKRDGENSCDFLSFFARFPFLFPFCYACCGLRGLGFLWLNPGCFLTFELFLPVGCSSGPVTTGPHDMLLSVEGFALSQYAQFAHAGEEGTDGVQTKVRDVIPKPWDVPVHSKPLPELPFALPPAPAFCL